MPKGKKKNPKGGAARPKKGATKKVDATIAKKPSARLPAARRHAHPLAPRPFWPQRPRLSHRITLARARRDLEGCQEEAQVGRDQEEGGQGRQEEGADQEEVESLCAKLTLHSSEHTSCVLGPTPPRPWCHAVCARADAYTATSAVGRAGRDRTRGCILRMWSRRARAVDVPSRRAQAYLTLRFRIRSHVHSPIEAIPRAWPRYPRCGTVGPCAVGVA